MNRKIKHLLYDAVLLAISIGFAVYIAKTGFVSNITAYLGELKWLGVFVAGMFFTSMFTTPPSIVLLGQMAETTPLFALVLIGGLGAAFGDYIIFLLVRDRVSVDVKYLLSISRGRRFLHIFKTRLFRFFVPFIGAAIIASPLPDEIGVAMLGLSKMKTRYFLVISFIFNSAGILAIGYLAKIVFH